MDRHWFPAIVTGFTVLLGLVFVAVFSPNQTQEIFRRTPDVREVTAGDTAISEDTYKGAVNAILEAYKTNSDAQATYDALIAVSGIPASMQTVHYELVIAFGKVISGNAADATARFTALKAQYPWLAL